MLSLLLAAAPLLQVPARDLAPAADPAARIACIGDSITYGATVAERERNSYPARLGQLLSGGWEVRNFGVGGRTLLRSGDKPYVATHEWTESLVFAPDVAVVMLGTNDTVQRGRGNWEHRAELAGDARTMIESLRKARPDVRVFLCSPPPMFPDAPGLSEQRRADLSERAPRLAQVGPVLRDVAAELDRVDFVDLADVLRVEHVTDGVHTNPFGADALAREILDLIEPVANPATHRTPSAEFRGEAAGWGGGTWWDQLDALNVLAQEHPDLELVFLGDSITQGLTGAGDRLVRAGGARAVDRHIGGRRAASLGISGDRTEHLLWRIRKGALTSLAPRVIVLQIGVNNVNAAGHTGTQTLEGVAAVVTLLRALEPQADVVVCGPFPAGREPDDPRRTEIDAIHAGLPAAAADERVHYLDLRGLFVDGNGRANGNLGADGVHVTSAGREAWMAALAPLVDGLLDG